MDLMRFSAKRKTAIIGEPNVTISMLEMIRFISERMDDKEGGSRLFRRAGKESSEGNSSNSISWIMKLHESA